MPDPTPPPQTPAGLTARPEYCACGALLEQIAPHLYVCRQCRPFGPGTDQPRLWYGYLKTGQSSPVVYAFLAAHDALLRELSGVRHAASASAPDGVPPDGGLVRFVRWVVETWRARAEAAEARLVEVTRERDEARRKAAMSEEAIRRAAALLQRQTLPPIEEVVTGLESLAYARIQRASAAEADAAALRQERDDLRQTCLDRANDALDKRRQRVAAEADAAALREALTAARREVDELSRAYNAAFDANACRDDRCLARDGEPHRAGCEWGRFLARLDARLAPPAADPGR